MNSLAIEENPKLFADPELTHYGRTTILYLGGSTNSLLIKRNVKLPGKAFF
jgi:hypothetical protein